MSAEVTPARLGYRSPALRVVNGSLLLGLSGWIGLGIIDRLAAFGNHAIDISKTADAAKELAFTYSIGTDGAAYGAAWALVPLLVAGASLGVGAIARNWRAALPTIPVVGGAAVLALTAVGLPAGLALPNVDQQVEQAWTSEHYGTTNPLPDTYQLDVVQPGTSSRYATTVNTAYPTPFVLNGKDGAEHYFLIESVRNGDNQEVGEKIREVSAAEAKAAKATYDKAVAANDAASNN